MCTTPDILAAAHGFIINAQVAAISHSPSDPIMPKERDIRITSSSGLTTITSTEMVESIDRTLLNLINLFKSIEEENEPIPGSIAIDTGDTNNWTEKLKNILFRLYAGCLVVAATLTGSAAGSALMGRLSLPFPSWLKTCFYFFNGIIAAGLTLLFDTKEIADFFGINYLGTTGRLKLVESNAEKLCGHQQTLKKLILLYRKSDNKNTKIEELIIKSAQLIIDARKVAEAEYGSIKAEFNKKRLARRIFSIVFAVLVAALYVGSAALTAGAVPAFMIVFFPDACRLPFMMAVEAFRFFSLEAPHATDSISALAGLPPKAQNELDDRFSKLETLESETTQEITALREFKNNKAEKIHLRKDLDALTKHGCELEKNLNTLIQKTVEQQSKLDQYKNIPLIRFVRSITRDSRETPQHAIDIPETKIADRTHSTDKDHTHSDPTATEPETCSQDVKSSAEGKNIKYQFFTSDRKSLNIASHNYMDYKIMADYEKKPEGSTQIYTQFKHAKLKEYNQHIKKEIKRMMNVLQPRETSTDEEKANNNQQVSEKTKLRSLALMLFGSLLFLSECLAGTSAGDALLTQLNIPGPRWLKIVLVLVFGVAAGILAMFFDVKKIADRMGVSYLNASGSLKVVEDNTKQLMDNKRELMNLIVTYRKYEKEDKKIEKDINQSILLLGQLIEVTKKEYTSIKERDKRKRYIRIAVSLVIVTLALALAIGGAAITAGGIPACLLFIFPSHSCLWIMVTCEATRFLFFEAVNVFNSIRAKFGLPPTTKTYLNKALAELTDIQDELENEHSHTKDGKRELIHVNSLKGEIKKKKANNTQLTNNIKTTQRAHTKQKEEIENLEKNPLVRISRFFSGTPHKLEQVESLSLTPPKFIPQTS